MNAQFLEIIQRNNSLGNNTRSEMDSLPTIFFAAKEKVVFMESCTGG